MTTPATVDYDSGMNFYEALGSVIRDERVNRGFTLREVSKSGYVSMGHLSDVENARKEGSGIFIEAVAKAIGIPTYELIIEAGYRMAEATEIPATPESLFDEVVHVHVPSPVGK